MVSYSKEELLYYLEDLSCQIDYLQRADNLNMLNEEDEFRLNSLIVKRAHYRQEKQNFDKPKGKVVSILSKINRFSRNQKRISDYFTSKSTD